MLQIWITVTTVLDAALAVVGLGIAGYALASKPSLAILYYGVAVICVLCALVGFVNLSFLHSAARQHEEKSRVSRDVRERRKAEKAARGEEPGMLTGLFQQAKDAFTSEPQPTEEAVEEPQVPQDLLGEGEKTEP